MSLVYNLSYCVNASCVPIWRWVDKDQGIWQLQYRDNDAKKEQTVGNIMKLNLQEITHLGLVKNIYITRPMSERRLTLGHLRFINPNMINHFGNQSQTCQLLIILKNIFFFKHWKETVKSVCRVATKAGWTDRWTDRQRCRRAHKVKITLMKTTTLCPSKDTVRLTLYLRKCP